MMKNVFNWSELHLSEVTSYKIHNLVDNLSAPSITLRDPCLRSFLPVIAVTSDLYWAGNAIKKMPADLQDHL